MLKTRQRFIRLALPLSLIAAAALSGCNRKEPRVYLAPKDAPPKPPAEETADATPEPPAPAERPTEADMPPMPKLAWTLPEGWKDLGAKGMNVASFQVGEATVSATPLASFAGKESEPVNLWRSIMGQTPLDEAAAEKTLVEIPIAGGKGKLFDLTGERVENTGQKVPTRIVTAFLHRGPATWFFKLQGPPSTVEPQIPVFKQFLATFRFEDTAPGVSTPAAPPTPKPPAAAPANPLAPPAPAASAPASVPGSLPAGWASQTPGPMQAAKFTVPEKDGAKAEVSVSIFPSDTGGTLANVRRWRGMLGLPDADDATVQADAKPLDGGPAGALLVELANNGQSFVGAIVPRGGSWYFYKLVGGAPAVASARESFIVFARAQ